jgi:hypothetical protein
MPVPLSRGQRTRKDKETGMAERQKELTDQVVVRVSPELRQALEEDAEQNGRTVAQTIRFRLAQQFTLTR